eukprot:7038281-Pyramimonas_sp.AAC.1
MSWARAFHCSCVMVMELAPGAAPLALPPPDASITFVLCCSSSVVPSGDDMPWIPSRTQRSERSRGEGSQAPGQLTGEAAARHPWPLARTALRYQLWQQEDWAMFSLEPKH